MKKIILICICIIFAVIGVMVLANQILTFMAEKENSNNKQPNNLNFELYGSYTVNASGVRKYFNLLEDIPLIGFFQIYDSEELYGEFAEVLDLELPDDFDFDFGNYQDKCLVITFGRKLVEIQYEYRKGFDVPFADITFTEEHHDQTMYLYIMDNIVLWNASFRGYDYNSFYVMNGSEKVYIGSFLQDFNKQSPSFVEGI